MTHERMQSALAELRFRLLFLFIAILFIGLTLLIFKAFSSYQYTRNKASALQENADAILYFDEVLTMSARMVAFTGDRYWETRYHECIPKLDLALQKTFELFPGAQEALEATRDANQRLIELELQAFALANAGQLRQAAKILFGLNYETDKKVYSDGLTRLRQHINAYKIAIQNQIRRDTLVSITIAALIFLLIILALVYILRLLDYRLKLEAITSDLSRHFIQHAHESIDDNIHWALQLMARSANANRCYLLRCDSRDAAPLPIEWQFPSESPSLLPVMSVLANECQNWRQIGMDQNGIWHWSDKKAITKTSKELLKKLNCDSLLGVSARSADGVEYLMVLTSSKKGLILSKTDSDLLHTIIEIIIQAIENKEKEDELLRLASTDPLTGIANRRDFTEQLRIEVMRVQRTLQAAALMMLDIDFFKQVNDTHGHAAGDAVLSHVARYAQNQLRQIDTIGRIGGEEFCVIVRNRDAENAMIAAERLRSGIEREIIATDAGAIKITVSIGVTLLKHVDQLESAMKRVDAALYAAKNGGRNQIKFL